MLPLAISLTSLVLPALAARRFGAHVGAIAFGLWLAVTAGALLLGAGLVDAFASVVDMRVLHAALYAAYALLLLHLAALTRPRLRGPAFHALVLVPGTMLSCAALIAIPFELAARALAFAQLARPLVIALEIAPLVIAASALVTSLTPRVEHVAFALDDGARPSKLARLPWHRAPSAPPRPEHALRLVQVADPHLGGLVSLDALRSMIARLVRHDPDLVLLTGDLLAAEGMFTEGALAEALAPLAALEGRCFAALGNHDLDALAEVERALAAARVTLLVNAAADVETRLGTVRVIGVDHVAPKSAERAPRLKELLARTTPTDGRPVILLLHDPSRVHDVPDDAQMLVLSGHVHGGQIGLLSLGTGLTILAGSKFPDFGLWGRGALRLYAHRGTGTFGFPLRIGVPGEESVLDVGIHRTT